MSNFGLNSGVKDGFGDFQKKRVTETAITYYDVRKGDIVWKGDNGYCYPFVDNGCANTNIQGIIKPSQYCGIVPFANGDFLTRSYNATNYNLQYYRYDGVLYNSVAGDGNNMLQGHFNVATKKTVSFMQENYNTSFSIWDETKNYAVHYRTMNNNYTNYYTATGVTRATNLNSVTNFGSGSINYPIIIDNNNNIIQFASYNFSGGAYALTLCVYNSSGTVIKTGTVISYIAPGQIGTYLTKNNILLVQNGANTSANTLIGIDCNNNYSKLFEVNTSPDINIYNNPATQPTQPADNSTSYSLERRFDVMDGIIYIPYYTDTNVSRITVRCFDAVTGTFLREAGFMELTNGRMFIQCKDGLVFLYSAKHGSTAAWSMMVLDRNLNFISVNRNALTMDTVEDANLTASSFFRLSTGEVFFGGLNDQFKGKVFKSNAIKYFKKYRILQNAKHFTRTYLEEIR